MKWIFDRQKSTESKLFSKNAPDTQRMREGQASALNETINNFRSKIKQQADDLDVKDVQIHIRTKAMDAVADGIFIIDARKTDFPFIYANQAYYTITGYTKGEILGKNYFLHYGHFTDPRFLEEIKQTLLQGKSFFGEMLQFKKNGERYWNLLRINPVRDTNGAVTHFVGIKTDITLMRQRELELKEQHEELMHVTRVGKLAEFVSSLAHEINQPLCAILSYAQAAQRILANPAKKGADRDLLLQEIHEQIIKDDQRASDVIRRLRSLLKKSVPEMKPMDINTVIKDTVMLITTDLNVRNNTLKLELEDDLPLVRGDRIQLQQVVLNLISNSFDAMEKVKGVREILIRTSRQGPGTIMVSVKDSGCGISVENLPKLFEHFFTSKPDGLGMGLSISRSIVEAHGGRLDVENNPDRGATFYFTLPADPKPSGSFVKNFVLYPGSIDSFHTAPRILLGRSIPNEGGCDMFSNIKQIYIVDDDESVRRSLKLLMISYGFKVETFSTSEAFFTSVPNSAEGCLILDIHMPQLNGWETQQRLAGTGSNRSVIVITGDKDGDFEKKALKAGMVGVLHKPFEAHYLLQMLIEGSIKQDEQIRSLV